MVYYFHKNHMQCIFRVQFPKCVDAANEWKRMAANSWAEGRRTKDEGRWTCGMLLLFWLAGKYKYRRRTAVGHQFCKRFHFGRATRWCSCSFRSSSLVVLATKISPQNSACLFAFFLLLFFCFFFDCARAAKQCSPIGWLAAAAAAAARR